MASNKITRLWLAFGALAALAACDHKGQHVAEGGTLAGLWIPAGAYSDWERSKASPDTFCDVLEAHRDVYRPFEEDGSDRPRVIEVTPNGDVLRWSPKGERGEGRRRHPVLMGIDRLRLIALNAMVRRGSDGDEQFTRVDERLATMYVRRLERCEHPRGPWRES